MKKNTKGNKRTFIKWTADQYFKFRSLSFVKHILLFYLFITVIGSLLLFLPISQQHNDVGYVDALFTSASAFSDTGLATMQTATTWTMFGQFIVAMLILIGGIGWFALKVYLFNILLGRPISFRSRETLAGERGNSRMGNTRRIIKISVSILFVLIIIATITLSLYFYFVEPTEPSFAPGQMKDLVHENPYHNELIALKFGAFHAISGLNNAGFDIIGSGSLEPYYNHYGLQIIFICLFVIGGIGYPVLYDIFQWFKSKVTKEKFKWSLFTKISMIAYVAVATVGLSLAFAMEVPKSDGMWSKAEYGSKGDKIMAIFFNTMSTRNAGFGTMPMNSFAPGTKIVYSFMMFIGSAPSSTAGGIRTTTIALVVLSLWSRIRGNTSVRAFNRRINQDTVNRASAVMVAALFVTLIGSFIVMTSTSSYGGSAPVSEAAAKLTGDHAYSFTDSVFETASAFGTTGLSTGMTAHLNLASKLILILIMFIGQLGVSSTLLVWDKKNNKRKKFKLVEEDITIG